ncbi:MAG: methylaspartate mutase, partial [Candidatus Bathyarchaeia archaeon]
MFEWDLRSNTQKIWTQEVIAVSRSRKPLEDTRYILAMDVGSTTTKARFLRKRGAKGGFGPGPDNGRIALLGCADRVRNAVRDEEELTEHLIMDEDAERIVVPCNGERGVDLYCTTS